MGPHIFHYMYGITHFSHHRWDTQSHTPWLRSHILHTQFTYHIPHTMNIEIPPLQESGKDNQPTGSLSPTRPLIGCSMDAALSTVASELESVLNTVRNELKKQLRQ